MLSGDNSILQKATTAKTETERQSVIEQARAEILGYQTENKGGDLEKSQLKAVLDIYFKEVPLLEELPDGDELMDLPLTTLDKYGTHTINVSEIYNGSLKTNTEKTISFSITVRDNNVDLNTYNLSCVEGYSWEDWARSNAEPFYANTTYNVCGDFHGSLQDLIINVVNNPPVYDTDDSGNDLYSYAIKYLQYAETKLLLKSSSDGHISMHQVWCNEDIVNDGNYVLNIYED